MTGKYKECALCKKIRELQDSHYMPKSLYNIARRKGGKDEIAAPVHSSPYDGKALFTSNQIKQHLLCSSCEEKLNKFGENTVVKECKRHNNFELREKYRLAIDSIDDEINFEPYAYFALSIVWRGSVADWGDGCNDIYNTLGEYEEPIRGYLAKKSGFPLGVYVRVFININDNYASGFGTPSYEVTKFGRRSRVRYEFNLPGLVFWVSLAGRFTRSNLARYKKYSIPISFEEKDFGVWDRYLEIRRKFSTQKPVGSLGLQMESKLKSKRV